MSRVCLKLMLFVVTMVPLSWGIKITSFTTQLAAFGPYTPGTTCQFIPVESGCFGLELEPQVYTNSDGSTWYSGAGAFSPGLTQVSSVSVVGGSVRYSLSPLTTSFSWAPQLGSGFLLFQEFDSGTQSTQGSFSAVGPLVLMAAIGSPVATLSGFLRINANPSDGFPGFEYFVAPVGAVIPFSETFQLESGGWDANTFNSSFNYTVSGQVNFTPTPEPTTMSLVSTGLIGMITAGLRRKKS